jgi:hypothetical protein
MDWSKICSATRTGPDTFDVTYNDPKEQAVTGVPYAYLLSTAKAGFIVEVDQRKHAPAGEPTMYRLEQE